MSDLISRRALCEYALNQKDKSITPNEIMRFPSAESHWIPCNERFPEYDEEVLCQDVGGNMMVLFRSERTNEWTDGLYYSEPLNMIVAWRELPKTYREF